MKTIQRVMWRLAIAAVAAAIGGCVHKTEEPPLTGPSTFATALNVSASPEIISLGPGALIPGETSTVTVEVFRSDGSPIPPGTMVRLDVIVNGNRQDCGTLAQRVLQIPSNGRTTTTFTAPGYPLPLPACLNFVAGSTISIAATLDGSNFQTAVAPIRMIQQGVILPPPGTPTPKFLFFPASPTVDAPVQFDARLSCAGPAQNGACAPTGGTIVSYQWNFGDGGTASGSVVYHKYAVAQNYTVTLIVTNDGDMSAGATQTITVTTGEPVASFTYTPDVGVLHTLNFDASGSKAAPAAKIVSYLWDFGDGVQQTTAIPIVSHTYSSLLAGLPRAVTLTVTDDVGRVSTPKAIQVTIP